MPTTEIESGLMSPGASPVKTRHQRATSTSAAPVRPAPVARTPSLRAAFDEEEEDEVFDTSSPGTSVGSGRRRRAHPPRRARRRRAALLKAPASWISV
jgi:hypothetical protein